MLSYTYIACLVKYLLRRSVGANSIVLPNNLFFVFNAKALLKINGFRIRTISMGVISGIKMTRFKSAPRALRFAGWEREVW
jgi:hypothetical protein